MTCGNGGQLALVALGMDEADGYMLIEDWGGSRYRRLAVLAKVPEGCRLRVEKWSRDVHYTS